MSSTIPDEWLIAPIGDICNIAIGGTPSRSVPEYWDSTKTFGSPWVSIRDLNKPWIHETSEYITESGIKHSNVKLVRKGTVLMSFKLSVGRVAFAGRDLYTNEAIAAFLPKHPNTYSDQFLYQGLQHWNLLENIDQAVKGVTLNKEKINQIETLLPPLPEQQKIAAILSSVDDVIEKTRAQINKLKDLKTGMMQELLTKGIGSDGVPHTEFKDSPVGRIPKDWSVKTLGETATLQRGHDLTQANSVMGCYPVVSSSGVSAMHDEYTTQGPGVVVGRKGSIGRVHYIQSDFWAHDTSLYVTNFHGNDVLFIYQLFSWLDLQKYGTKSGSPSLNRNDLHPLKLALPPVAEQIEIREILMQVDERTSLLRRKLSHLTDLKKALMQDLLTGKVRVNVDQKESAVA